MTKPLGEADIRKAFIVGGAGFIGSHLVDRLIASREVTVYDDMSSGRLAFLEHHRSSPSFRFVRGDALDFETLYDAMGGHDVVFHLAANPDARASITDTRLDLRLGTLATYNVLEAMRRHGIRRIVFSSSGTIYGDMPFHPIPESHGPVLPISLYGASKLASEGLISAFAHTFDMHAWIYRFTNIVGGRATHGVALDFITKLKADPSELEILGDGKQEKPYLLVDDCVGGILFGMSRAAEQVNLFHLSTNSTTTVGTIAHIVVEEMGLRGVNFRFAGGSRGWPGDIPLVNLDTSKMGRLGWTAQHTSDEAVRIAVRRILGKADS
jgi:UDP-glucose 4-epimerase